MSASSQPHDLDQTTPAESVLIGDYLVPCDPMDDLACDFCQ